jgi:hypothetical protein
MSNEIAKYYELNLENLDPREKFYVGCRLLDDVVPELSSQPFRVADELWEKIYKAELILQTKQPQQMAIDLLGQCLELLENYRRLDD